MWQIIKMYNDFKKQYGDPALYLDLFNIVMANLDKPEKAVAEIVLTKSKLFNKTKCTVEELTALVVKCKETYKAYKACIN